MDVEPGHFANQAPQENREIDLDRNIVQIEQYLKKNYSVYHLNALPKSFLPHLFSSHFFLYVLGNSKSNSNYTHL